MSRQDVERGGPKPSQFHNSNYTSTYYAEQSERQWRSWLVPLIVIANVAMFIGVMYVNNCPRNVVGVDKNCVAGFLGRFSFQPLGENPLFGPSASALLKMGALRWYNVVRGHQWWRLFSCMWLHAGLIHLVVNMISLVFIGIRLEQQFGFVRVGIIYLISGFGGSVLSSLYLRDNISIGASGALFGLLGAMLSELLTNWSIYTNRAAALFTLIVVIAINLAVGILPHVDNFAHIGGFLTGYFLGFIFLLRPQYGWVESRLRPVEGRVVSKHKAYQYVYFVISLLLLITGFTVGLVMLFKGVNGNDHCSWCHYLSCVPTSRWSC